MNGWYVASYLPLERDIMWKRTLLGGFGAASVALFATQAPSQEIFGAKFSHQLTPPEFCVSNKGRYFVCQPLARMHASIRIGIEFTRLSITA